jgi:tetracycline resistance efflux pump
MSWVVFIPPLLVFLVGIFFHRIILALIIGICASALIVTHGAPIDSVSLIGLRFYETFDFNLLFSFDTLLDCDTIIIMLFPFIIGIVIEMIHQSGGARALILKASSSIRCKRGVETSSLLLSHCLFIDDYLSCLTVGSVLRPLADKHLVPRAKLAFLVDIMAASLAILCPVSAWAAAIIGFLSDNGIGETVEETIYVMAPPNMIYLRTLPYIFYSFTVIVTVWFIVRRKISFGLMRSHEKIAHEKGHLFGPRKKGRNADVAVTDSEAPAYIMDFIVPIGTLLVSVFLGLLYWGEYRLFGGDRSFVSAIQNARASIVLLSGSAISFIVSVVYYLLSKRFSYRRLPKIIFRGAREVFPVIAILTCSWTFGTLLREDVRTGTYLAVIIGDSLPLYLLPCIFFVIALATAISIGTALGTAAILFPIAIPLVVSLSHVATPATPDQMAILFPVLGAILAGGVCGCNTSVIADTTILSSASSSCHHFDHFNTQWRYVLPMAIGSVVAFAITGLLVERSMILSIVVPLIASISISLLIVSALHMATSKK